MSLLMNTNEHDAAVLEVELQTNRREGYAKFYNDGEGTYCLLTSPGAFTSTYCGLMLV